jgi:hypothetical protein
MNNKRKMKKKINRTGLGNFDLDKSWVRGRYNCAAVVHKEEPWSIVLCLNVCLAGVSTCLHPLDQEKLPRQEKKIIIISWYNVESCYSKNVSCCCKGMFPSQL